MINLNTSTQLCYTQEQADQYIPTTCKSNQYYSSANVSCINCKTGCSSCTSANVCSSCISGY